MGIKHERYRIHFFNSGSSRLGSLTPTDNIRHYELTNHLSNVLTMVNDRIDAATQKPQIENSVAYEPFGRPMSGLSYYKDGANKYDFGFQSQENVSELFGGKASWFKYRISDNRLGRFFTIDPLASKYPHNSPYAFSENRVIDAIELEGLESYLIVSMQTTGINPLLNAGDGYAFGAKKMNKVVNTETVKILNNASKEGTMKGMTYTGIVAGICFGGIPGLILGPTALGLNGTKDIALAINSQSKAKDAPTSLTGTLGFVADKIREKQTGIKSNTFEATGDFLETVLTMPFVSLGTAPKYTLAPKISESFKSALDAQSYVNGGSSIIQSGEKIYNNTTQKESHGTAK